MGLTGRFDVPTFHGTIPVEVSAGASIVFVGANGAGKTRLGVLLDTGLSNAGVEVHRIAAHRSLTLNPEIVPSSLEIATKRLRYGWDQGTHAHKHGHRYGGKPETALLSDYDLVLSALYAENNDVSVAYRQARQVSYEDSSPPPSAKIDTAKKIWESVLPHRQLIILGNALKTATPGGQEYSASDMSDGERVTFYLIAQALLAQPDTLLIFDEPELHINRSILAKLWDEIEAARPDCCFLYITHDVDFASSRHAATKYALREFRRDPSDAWDIELVPENGSLPDDIVATIIGSRRPVLFVEGDGGSLDSSLYRRVYGDFTVVPVGGCEQVIQTVATFAARPDLHRVGCAGLVDADGRTDGEAAYLETKGVYRLPVSEIENVFLLPGVFLALAASLNFSANDARTRLSTLQELVFSQAGQQIDAICLRYARRRVDSEMKKIGLASNDITSLDTEFKQAAGGVNPINIFNEIKAKLGTAIASQDYRTVLLYYDNKGLLNEVARLLGYQQKSLEEFIGRTLRSDASSVLHAALADELPVPVPRP
ncbi:MAG: AAA family ATPase [Sphingomonas sanguinis]|uniref:AAA family ATPase n=1 Tax=Sphingomonas sanguinis TaxID=33051 RepID=A0A7Y7QTX8_9SPHN|nr:AAA family ATPase [Sphingomonas sanguinis]NNG53103.1 AAA family ATPase [Sphingomonas sanguinis]NVP30612.1 AAA family ATPase [Sphingomonas sanguinis]